jgi:hypothetical protein
MAWVRARLCKLQKKVHWTHNKLKAIVNDTNVYSEVAVTTYSGSSKQHSIQQFY